MVKVNNKIDLINTNANEEHNTSMEINLAKQAKQTKGIKRNTIDKYYTKDVVVELCTDLVKKHIQINFLLHNLRLFIKYNKNKKHRNHKLYMNNLLNELLTFKPNIKIKVLTISNIIH